MTMRGRPTVVGKDRVYIRVLLSREDYGTLKKIADAERTDISTMSRRAIAKFFLVPHENTDNNQSL